MNTDHAHSDDRIALQRVIVDWLGFSAPRIETTRLAAPASGTDAKVDW
jgi:hypothetical protein